MDQGNPHVVWYPVVERVLNTSDPELPHPRMRLLSLPRLLYRTRILFSSLEYGRGGLAGEGAHVGRACVLTSAVSIPQALSILSKKTGLAAFQADAQGRLAMPAYECTQVEGLYLDVGGLVILKRFKYTSEKWSLKQQSPSPQYALLTRSARIDVVIRSTPTLGIAAFVGVLVLPARGCTQAEGVPNRSWNQRPKRAANSLVFLVESDSESSNTLRGTQWLAY
ncbi:hypothetical protein BJV74DRAFT_887067 [Russula compacta]|nr:hypothetical protein BJV74DRAFT_887067 [Russula compacta]